MESNGNRKYIDSEKLIAEIDNRLHCNGAFDEVGDSAWAYDQGMVDAYHYILSFVTSLQQEQQEVDFETEYAKFTNAPDAVEYAFPIDLADYKDFARHFYELGKNSK